MAEWMITRTPSQWSTSKPSRLRCSTRTSCSRRAAGTKRSSRRWKLRWLSSTTTSISRRASRSRCLSKSWRSTASDAVKPVRSDNIPFDQIICSIIESSDYYKYHQRGLISSFFLYFCWSWRCWTSMGWGRWWCVFIRDCGVGCSWCFGADRRHSTHFERACFLPSP